MGCSTKAALEYPVATTEEVKDTYFGVEVTDPYRWLENDTSEATMAWVKAENEVTAAYIAQIPFRDRIKERMTELTNYEKIGTPFKRHGKYYFYKNDGLQNQSVLYVKDTLDGEARVLLDPNKLSEDGTVALAGISFSNNGKYLAYTISRSGSDWNEIFVLDLASNKLLDDHILWSKFGGPSWQGDGFYYSAYDKPAGGKEFSNVNENHKIYYHEIGKPQSADRLEFQNPAEPRRFYNASVNEDETILFVSEGGAGRGNNLFMKDLRKPNAPLVALTTDMDYEYYPVEVIGNKVYVQTNYQAPKYAVACFDIAKPLLKDWTTLIPESESVLSSAQVIGEKFFLVYMKDASHHAYVYGLNGKEEYEVTLPTLGSVSFSGDKDDKEVFYTFTSFTFPATIYRFDMDNNRSEVYLAPKVAFTPEEYVTEQVFYPSADGTRIPMFLTYKKGLKKDGTNPVLLYGYGGFNVSLNPGFSTIRLPFLESGGIYAMANLRGGGEYGEEWHTAGTLMNKQNVFDDFIAAAEYLINEKYTHNTKIAINGGSNGGLLVGAVVNQRPDLFQVAIPDVGVMDMLRYHLFTIGWNWASDYGTSADNKEMFDYLYAYSPLHTIKNDGTPYPAILINTADHDDRVVPAHSFKYAATLQAANTGDAPKLIRIESNAGHGAGKPISKILDEYADTYAFMMYNLGMSY
ncbi:MULTISPECIES: prolyl oligopeptidase family serine peptidase [unclassified Parabacteroides]|uniref:prolyl oligopeptidase family serine peptidase n=1 Tax=unclassified Parabacteroides TaxID=2649774 RepID=UPI002472F4FA|nr:MULTISPECIES: prolyl oligopeptidase family serine peptidase [unclassified Parabacteroides]